MPTPTHYGEQLRKCRERKGLSLERTVFQAWQLLPERHQRSYGMLHRMEKGDIDEADIDLVFLAAVAQVLDADVEDISPAGRDELDVIVSLAERKRQRRPRRPGGGNAAGGGATSSYASAA